MRCPTCGHDNNDLATRCSACGSPLPAATPDAANNEPTATHGAGNLAQDTEPLQDETAERWQTPVESPSQRGEDPQLKEVAGTAGKFVASKRRRMGEFLRTHDKALGIGLALCVVGVMGVVWAILNLTNAPAYSQIEADISVRIPTFQYAGGTYGPDLEIPLSSTVVTGRSATQTPEGVGTSSGIGPAAYSVQAEATYDDGKIHVVRNVAATYVRTGDGWSINGELAEQGTSYFARTGVDENKVLANMDAVLAAGSAPNGTSLSSIYANGSFSIVGNDFEETPEKDTATDDVVIHCSQQDGFSSYEGNVIARFAFESGEWVLRGVEADSQATTRTYEPLVGSWTGTLVSHEADDGSCYGAQDHALTIVINALGDASADHTSVQGTISGIAHYHGRLESDELLDEDDQLMEGVPFSGAISSDPNLTAGGSINLEGATSGSPDGDVSFVVSFGTGDDPSAVVARVTTTYSYEELLLFLIPHDTTARFTDTYLLSKA